MLKWIGDRFTSAHVIALIALFVALGGSVYAASKINGARIKKNSEPGNRLKTNTVTGKQINEATINGLTRGSSTASTASGGTSSSCDPSSSTFVDCGTTSLNLPRKAKVLVIANAFYDGGSSGSGYRGDCKLLVDGARIGAQPSNGNSDGFGVGFNSNQQASMGMNAVTGALGKGSHDFSLQCNQAGGSIEFPETYVSAVMIGTG